MITILMRIFPFDISEYIFIIYKSMIIHDIMIPRLYTFELVLDNLIKIYCNAKNSMNLDILIAPNYKGFKLISYTLQYIKKYDYKIDVQLQNKIYQMRLLIPYLILNNSNKYFNKLLTDLL